MKPPLVCSPVIAALCTNNYTETHGTMDVTADRKEQNNVTRTIHSWLSLEKNETIYTEPLKGVSADIDESTRNLVTQPLV
jgi:hypothetical protein